MNGFRIVPHSEIKSKVTSADICSARGYEVNRAGFVPCGNEKTPSLKIYDDGGWRCYRCDEGGDCFDLLMHLDGMSKKEALSYCADLAGVQLEEAARVVVVVPKCDCEALRAAYEATSLDLKYTRKHFADQCAYGLYKAILLGREMDNVEILRNEMRYLSNDSWSKSDNVRVNEYIWWLTEQEWAEAYRDAVDGGIDAHTILHNYGTYMAEDYMKELTF